MSSLPQATIQRLACIELTTPDAAALCRFYERALGFSIVDARCDERNLRRAASGIARSVAMAVGRERIELQQFDRPGRSYPPGAYASDLCFQHFAIVVTDMMEAYQRLCSVSGWSAISTDGPQRLPPSSGGVDAFKFRDPDGHPLELLAFSKPDAPPRWKAHATDELFLGIDHSAISVSDSLQSIAFYEALGLRVTSRSLNSGSEQARLDGLMQPRVEVTALSPPCAHPHVELLGYRSAERAERPDLQDNDVATTRLVFEAALSSGSDPKGPRRLIDPDGHHLVLIAAVERNQSLTTNLTAHAGMPPNSAKPESAR